MWRDLQCRFRHDRSDVRRAPRTHGEIILERFIVYLPRWFRWTLLVVLAALVVGFTAAFFFGINRPGFKDWLPASVSVVQIALTALAYVLLVFFTESAQSPVVLQRRTQQVLTALLPQALERICDVQGEPVRVRVGPSSGIVGRDYTLETPNTRVRVWVGLNVHRVIVVLFCRRPDRPDDDDGIRERLAKAFEDTTRGAQAIGYDAPHVQVEQVGECRFASIWLTWDIGSEEDFLTHAPSQLFFAQDTALMVQSFLRTAQRRGLVLDTELVPMPL